MEWHRKYSFPHTHPLPINAEATWFGGTQVGMAPTFRFFCPRSCSLDIDHWLQCPEWDSNPVLYDSGQVTIINVKIVSIRNSSFINAFLHFNLVAWFFLSMKCVISKLLHAKSLISILSVTSFKYHTAHSLEDSLVRDMVLKARE